MVQTARTAYALLRAQDLLPLRICLTALEPQPAQEATHEVFAGDRLALLSRGVVFLQCLAAADGVDLAALVASAALSADPADSPDAAISCSATAAGDVPVPAASGESAFSRQSDSDMRFSRVLRRLLAVLQLNSFHMSVADGRQGKRQQQQQQQYCMFGLTAHLNHSCAPTACHYLDVTTADSKADSGAAVADTVPRCMLVRAVRDIAAGEEVTIAYMELAAPRPVRLIHLREVYLFACSCARCGPMRQPDDRFLEALAPGMDPASAAAEEACGRVVAANEHALDATAAGPPAEALRAYEELLRLASGALHPRHHWVYNAHLAAGRLLLEQVRRGRAAKVLRLRLLVRQMGEWPCEDGMRRSNIMSALCLHASSLPCMLRHCRACIGHYHAFIATVVQRSLQSAPKQMPATTPHWLRGPATTGRASWPSPRRSIRHIGRPSPPIIVRPPRLAASPAASPRPPTTDSVLPRSRRSAAGGPAAAATAAV